MCGIIGILDHAGLVTEATLVAMAERIRYRGPDSSGVWLERDEGLGFAHRRLSIVDLSPAGHQPMHSSTGRYTITFNGEVFNFKELAQCLSTPLRGGSDTEVMLACFEAYGVKASVERFVGMFAFAVWDRQERTVILVRDRLGIKPLYYGLSNGAFIFASDLHAFTAVPGWGAQISRDALMLFMRYGFVPAPWSIYEGVFKLPPGTFLQLSIDSLAADSLATRKLPTPEIYWSMEDVSARAELIEDPDEVLLRTEALLEEAIRLRMIADVPLGAFLSGGIDSSLVVALMQRQASTPVRSFAIGFGEAQYNEAPFARAVADHLHTDHLELRVTPHDAQLVIPSLQEISDEPFGDSSIIPTYLVSKLAREQVTVSLSGDGGDELFGGYDRYLLLDRVFSAKRFLPRPLNSALLKAAHLLPLAQADKLQTLLQKSGFFPFTLNQPGEKIRRVLSLLDARTAEELYYRSIQHWPDDANIR
jgi:asparagine synthase (glutamine-hydrolysing)